MAMEILLEVVRWIVAVPAALLFLMCIVGNWSLVIGAALGKLKRFSLVLPFLGPVFGIAFFVLVPIDGMARYWWLATLLEPTWMLGILGLLGYFTGAFNHSAPSEPMDSSHETSSEHNNFQQNL